ncbi:MAG: flavodoxin family protein [Bacteroidia bacterium]|nr:flavodoxin family protein [Bacteroidia bacterium]
MKLLGINCSPRKGGNTEILIKEVFKSIEKNGIKTEFFQLGGKKVNGCIACLKCRELKDGQCHQENEVLNKVIKKMVEADAVIIGSPTYFSDLCTEAKALIDVAGYCLRGAGNPLKKKPGAAVISVRRAGAIHAFDSINHFFLINEMIIPGSSYWNIGVGGKKGEVANDEEGLEIMRVLGENMAWLLKRLNGSTALRHKG